MRPGALAVLMLAWAGQGLAQTPPCALNGLAPLAVQDEAKAAFLAGRYEAFYRLATPLVPEAKERYGAVIGKLPVLLPAGFADCSTILRRQDPGGMTQEISLFRLKPPGTGVLALLLVTAPVGGADQIIFFSFNEKITQVLEDLR